MLKSKHLIKTDGLKRIDAVTQNDKNMVTSAAIYSAIGDVIGYGAGLVGTTDNLNDVYTLNRLRFYNATYSTSRNNAPSGWVGGILVSYKNSTFGFQICFAYGSTAIYVRTFYNNNGWNAWKTVSLS